MGLAKLHLLYLQTIATMSTVATSLTRKLVTRRTSSLLGQYILEYFVQKC